MDIYIIIYIRIYIYHMNMPKTEYEVTTIYNKILIAYFVLLNEVTTQQQNKTKKQNKQKNKQKQTKTIKNKFIINLEQ